VLPLPGGMSPTRPYPPDPRNREPFVIEHALDFQDLLDVATNVEPLLPLALAWT
jgi:hypothetical protein